jgi:Uma2 family endonuclease
MTVATAKLPMTPEQLLNLPDAVNYELVDGQLVVRHMGSESSAIALAIGSLLRTFVRSRHAGHVFAADCGYLCFPDAPGKIRKPDVSFIRTGRLPNERPPLGHIEISPDLAVEVLSPRDLAYEVDEKITEYLAAGVRLIWVVNPKTRTVRIHRPGDVQRGPISTLNHNETITGEEVLPGFECQVLEFFDI